MRKKIEQPGLDFGENSGEARIQRPKTFAEYTTQQKLGFEKRLARKKRDPGKRLDQDELDYLEARDKALSGQ